MYITTLSSCTWKEDIKFHFKYFWATMWLLQIEPRIFGRLVNALNLWTIALDTESNTYINKMLTNLMKFITLQKLLTPHKSLSLSLFFSLSPPPLYVNVHKCCVCVCVFVCMHTCMFIESSVSGFLFVDSVMLDY